MGFGCLFHLLGRDPDEHPKTGRTIEAILPYPANPAVIRVGTLQLGRVGPTAATRNVIDLTLLGHSARPETSHYHAGMTDEAWRHCWAGASGGATRSGRARMIVAEKFGGILVDRVVHGGS